MTAHYQVAETPNSIPRSWFWHKRGANGEITTSADQGFTRHDNAVRGIRTDLETSAEILGISRESFRRLYGPALTYFDVTDESAGPFERPLYPVEAPDDIAV